ncbi:unnamed protein product [Dovyalis caffra]|uniref:Protein MULTIPOLAR SPINDLE 1 n=1 Tax=Dovyalis caffra TaxID=77055 RepID=A0AAV1RR49_9ROSI|nr:unnamed protein product [Dovyalis caffra]
MSSSEPATNTKTAASLSTDDQSLKFAVAISLLRSKLLQKQPPQNPTRNNPPSESDALRWKRKAKERKQELLRLREDLKEAEDASQCDLFPQTALCKCYFFDSLGKLSPKSVGDGSNRRFNDALLRRFLRQDIYSENVAEQLRAAVDFLVELCATTSPVEQGNFANWSHQAADFILGNHRVVLDTTPQESIKNGDSVVSFHEEKLCRLIGHDVNANRTGSILTIYAIIASLRNLLSIGNNMELIEGIVSSLIVLLVKKMCSPSHGDESHQIDTDMQFYIQHLIRKLGCEPYIGQRVILSVSQRISMVAENLLFLDPFDEAFPNMHECLFIMIQLIEFLISDYLLTWSRDEDFDYVLFEEWVTSVLHARKAVELLESRNGLYVLYMDRVAGELAKHVGQVSSFQKLNQEISKLGLGILSLLFLSQSLPSSAARGQFDKVLTKSQLPQGRQNDLISSFQTRKLGVYIRKRARSYPRTGRKSSAIGTQISSSHMIGSVLASLSFFLF